MTATTQESDALYHDPRLADFYDLDNGWYDDTRTCLKLSEGAASVLDLGCGTGLLASAIAKEFAIAQSGARVTGVDPAPAMLDIARRRDGGTAVTWVEGDGRSVRLNERFDFILMTGHAFQCLLTDADQLALLKTIAAHLTPTGRFIFDSRNPKGREWLEWNPKASHRFVTHPKHGQVESWNDYTYDEPTGVVTYGTYYRLGNGDLLAAKSKIRFGSQENLARLIAEAGLAVDRWMGDWLGADYTPASKEIIPLGRLA
ncbi:class I SAM-dependent methyltransferase [Dongia rigui]|uniref:Methyltransferase domain-containing protein n=1 Tax=Dongia rigui TaxID=940149 RepID=A0ABU5DYJ5_9PROT|nr:methyltransferase domain-containing protein [Dongia rigui]MDY0872397.1 methyltransferase domain-containing protein [Dongia rigui]